MGFCESMWNRKYSKFEQKILNSSVFLGNYSNANVLFFIFNLKYIILLAPNQPVPGS